MSAVDWDDELKQLLGDPCDHCGRLWNPWRDDQPRCHWCSWCAVTSCRGAVIIGSGEPLPYRFRNAGPRGDVNQGDSVCLSCLAEHQRQRREVAS